MTAYPVLQPEAMHWAPQSVQITGALVTEGVVSMARTQYRQAVSLNIIPALQRIPLSGIPLGGLFSPAIPAPHSGIDFRTAKRTVQLMPSSDILDTPKAGTGRSIQVTDTASPPKPRVRQGEIPMFLRIKARNMYLQQCLPYRAISEATGLPVPTLEKLAHREGWTALRREAKERLLKAADARGAAIESEIVESAIAISEQHLIRSLDKTGEALERTDRDAARDSQSYSATAKNLVGIVKALRDPQSDAPGDKINLGIFIVRPDAPRAEAKQVEALPVETTRVQ